MASAATLDKSPLMRLFRRFSGRDFLTWWGRGLLAWLPPAWQRRLVSTPRDVVLELHDGGPGGVEGVLLREGEKPKELGRQRFEYLTPKIVKAALSQHPGYRRIVRLPAHYVLARDLRLPLAAGANLYRIVGFDLDRLTPFKPDGVYYDVVELGRDRASRTLTARLVVIPRKRLNEWLARIEQRAFRPAIVTAVGQPSSLNLLPPERRPKQSKNQRGRGALALLTLLLLGIALALPLWQQRQLVIELLPQVERAQASAERVFALRNQLDRAVASSQFLLEQRRDHILMVRLLDELTQILPDNTYLEQVDLRDGELQLRGQSQQATLLIELMENSLLFSNVAFRSPVTSDRRTGRERFYLTAQLEQANSNGEQ